MGPATSAHPQSLQARAGDADGSGRAGHVRRLAALDDGDHRCRDRLVHHHHRRDPRMAQGAFRVPVLAAAVGIYLPLELSVPIFLGGVLGSVVARKRGGESENRSGMLYAAGLITGESLVGVLIAVPIVRHTSRRCVRAAACAAVRRRPGSCGARAARLSPVSRRACNPASEATRLASRPYRQARGQSGAATAPRAPFAHPTGAAMSPASGPRPARREFAPSAPSVPRSGREASRPAP